MKLHRSAFDLTNLTFCRLTAIEPTERRTSTSIVWRCVCECGREAFVNCNNLRMGQVQSCGCLRNERLREAKPKTQPRRVSPEEMSWRSMVARCTRRSSPSFDRYGGRGIAICQEWRDFNVFLRDMGPRPSLKHSLERLDNDAGYNPQNCVWATAREQSRNNSRNVMLTYRGVTKCLTDWAIELGFGKVMLRNRLRRGWSIEDAFSTPVER